MAESDLKVSSSQSMADVPAPPLPYHPPALTGPPPSIGLIGCGGITAYHLGAYRAAGYPVVALCNRSLEKAEARRAEYYPDASVHTDYREVLARPDVAVVDIATHAEIRGPMIEAALRAGKHVLSQKPFTLDLDEGERLADLARECGLRLAVNQNGRWAPHFSYMREAIRAGHVGAVQAVHLDVHWDHTWTENTVFNEMSHLILFDFAIHWFDMLCCFMGDARPLRVYASEARTAEQTNKPPMLGQVLVEYEHTQATLVFDAATRCGAADRSMVVGETGTLTSTGPDLSHQTVKLFMASGMATPRLEGEWFTNGFHGAMAELLQAVEQDREPTHGARDNLSSLALCFAAIESARTHLPQRPGAIRRLPD